MRSKRLAAAELYYREKNKPFVDVSVSCNLIGCVRKSVCVVFEIILMQPWSGSQCAYIVFIWISTGLLWQQRGVSFFASFPGKWAAWTYFGQTIERVTYLSKMFNPWVVLLAVAGKKHYFCLFTSIQCCFFSAVLTKNKLPSLDRSAVRVVTVDCFFISLPSTVLKEYSFLLKITWYRPQRLLF